MRLLAITLLALFAPSAAMAEDLPRVLILGDSVYREPARQAATALKGKAEIVFPAVKPGEARNSSMALVNLDVLLGEEKWDLIHFNFGLGDLIHRAPGMKSFRTMSVAGGGIRATSPADYEKNLTAIVKRLKSTGAKLIWASTTPIQGDDNGLYEIGSEAEYNAIAAKIMATNRIPISEMHAAVSTMLADQKHSKGPFTFPKGVSIHPPLVAAICRSLSIPVPRKADK